MGEQRQIKSQQTRKMTLHFENAMYQMPFKKSGATLTVHLELSKQMTATNANWVTSDKLIKKASFRIVSTIKLLKALNESNVTTFCVKGQEFSK